LRFLVSIAALAAMLFAPTSAGAQVAVPPCQTPNGFRAFGEIANELRAVGYGGPWDVPAMAAAYSRATGGPVNCPVIPPALAAPPQQPRVLLVGGVESLVGAGTWDNLEQLLPGRPVSEFKYNAGGPLDEATATCQGTAQSRSLLASTLRAARDAGVPHIALVGHSLGGVLAVDTLVENPDLVPFVNSVVAFDSPFGGINTWSWVRFGADCQSTNELIERRYHEPEWQQWYDQQLPALLDRGLLLRIISNDLDTPIGWEHQCICDLNVNWRVAVDGPNLGHSAVFYDPATLSRIAGAVLGR
jgi:hypothetical protein